MAVGSSNALILRHWKMRGGDKPSIFQQQSHSCLWVASGSATGLAMVNERAWREGPTCSPRSLSAPSSSILSEPSLIINLRKIIDLASSRSIVGVLP